MERTEVADEAGGGRTEMRSPLEEPEGGAIETEIDSPVSGIAKWITSFWALFWF